jgi:hypothetical protein
LNKIGQESLPLFEADASEETATSALDEFFAALDAITADPDDHVVANFSSEPHAPLEPPSSRREVRQPSITGTLDTASGLDKILAEIEFTPQEPGDHVSDLTEDDIAEIVAWDVEQRRLANPGRHAALEAHKKFHEPYLAKVEENHAIDMHRAGPGREDHNMSKREDREKKAKEEGRPFKHRNSKRTPEQKKQQQADADARHYQKNKKKDNASRSERRRLQRIREKQERQRQEELAQAAMLESRQQF